MFDDETAESLLACASDRQPRNFDHDPKLTEIPALPPWKNALLDTLVRHETGGPAYGYRFLGVNGTRIDDQYGISWKGTEAVARVSGQPVSDEIGIRVMTAGSGTVEATSLTAARQADRKLFWSGLLVGIAGSCLLMLFESLPWRSGPRTPTPSGED